MAVSTQYDYNLCIRMFVRKVFSEEIADTTKRTLPRKKRTFQNEQE